MARIERSRAVVPLVLVRQARGVAERGPRHAEARAWVVISSAKRASLPPRFSPMVEAMSLAERVTSAMIASSTRIVEPALRPSLVGGMAAARAETLSLVSSVEPALVQGLEDEIEGHHLGQRGRVGLGIRLVRVQHLAAVVVDQDRGLLAGKGRGGQQEKREQDCGELPWGRAQMEAKPNDPSRTRHPHLPLSQPANRSVQGVLARLLNQMLQQIASTQR